MYGVEIGLLVGTLINITNLLRLWARPEINYDIYEVLKKVFIYNVIYNFNLI